MLVLSGRAVSGGGTYRAIGSALLGQSFDPQVAASAELRPFRHALGAVLPGWAAAEPVLPTGPVDPVLVLAEGLRRLLEAHAGSSGCVLVAEDLHWADADTVALLGYLSYAARTAPLLVVATVREEPGSPAGSVLQVLAEGDAVSVLHLGRLDHAAVMRLAVGIPAAAEVPEEVLSRAVARAEGLPVLVEELVAGLTRAHGESAGVPPTMATMVAARMATLDDTTTRLLRAAAVLGADPDWTLLTALTGFDTPTVLSAVRNGAAAGLLLPDPHRLRWRHELSGEAVLAGLTGPERSHLARVAADALA